MRIRLIALFVFGVGGTVALMPCGWGLRSLIDSDAAVLPIFFAVPVATAAAGFFLARGVLLSRAWKWFAVLLPLLAAVLLPVATYLVACALELPSPKWYSGVGLHVSTWSFLFLPVTVPLSIIAAMLFRDMVPYPHDDSGNDRSSGGPLPG
jgi:hypothetical protein